MALYAKRWEILSQTESLASGSLYSVKDVKSNKIFLAKKLPLSCDGQPEAVSDEPWPFFFQVPLVAMASEGESTLLIYDLSLEASLSSELDLKSFSFKESGSFVSDLAAGLKELHDVGLVHGRLFPDSCLISKAGSILISECNLPWAWKTIAPYELPYIDPLNTDHYTRNPGTDVYAFGINLYQLATGHLPFSVRRIEELTSRAEAIPPPTGKLSTSWPLPTFELIEACTTLDAKKRIKSMTPVIDFLSTLRLPTRTSVTMTRPISNRKKGAGICLTPLENRSFPLGKLLYDSTIIRILIFGLIIYLAADLLGVLKD